MDRSKQVIVSGPFDKIDSRTFRFLQEASCLGPLEVRLWSDKLTESVKGKAPHFSQAEREYVLDALLYVQKITAVDEPVHETKLPGDPTKDTLWAIDEREATEAKKAFCAAERMGYKVISNQEIEGYPTRDAMPTQPDGKHIIVTGCYDWFHSGHVRFFEEVSEYGNLHVVIGHDKNIRELKGEGHPMFCEDMRRYMAQSIRFVTQAYVSTGHGWMDAEPEIERLKPDIYAVNSDGDRPEKQEFCKKHNLEYLVLKRKPKPGLTRRSSTDLRGF